MELLVTIGLDADVVQPLRERLEARIVAYPAVPPLYSLGGQLFVESASVAGRWLTPRGVIFYGYFDGAGPARRALALSTTPTFPDVRSTLPLDERAMALVLAMRADEPGPGRGFVPAGTTLKVERDHVIKWGNRHCGEDKARFTGSFEMPNDAVVEAFVDGRSERILLVGESAWQLHYESADWRKNVKATVTTVNLDSRLVARARHTAQRLGLAVAGVDYIVNDDGARLLEVNAYPGFDDVPDAADAFVELAARWWARVTSTSPPWNDRALRDEFNAEKGSFLLQLRCDLLWDPAAFRRLTREMLAYAQTREPESDLPRWVADGFWYASWYVKSWSEHPNFPRPLPAEYYEAAYERLSDLAFWVFTGQCPSTDARTLEKPLPGEPSDGSDR